MSESLQFKPILEKPDLVSNPVLEVAKSWKGTISISELLVTEIDPEFMGGKELSEHYGVDPSEGANCIIVEATNGGDKSFVAILVPVGFRADLNGIVRKHLHVKRISFAPLDKVLEVTGMEYGSITPFGLPLSWKILVDSLLTNKERIIVGGGKQISKLLLPTAMLKELPNVEIIEGLSNPVTL